MNRTLWKLDHIGERMRVLSTMTVTQAVSLANEGKGIAVVAEEARQMSIKITDVVDKAMFEGEDIDRTKIMALAFQLNLLALNCAIESSRIIGFAGKPAAIYADEIRGLAYEIICLFDEASAEKKKQTVPPWAANPSTAAQNGEFLLMDVGGIQFVEPLANIKEICVASEHRDGSITVRNMEIPLIDGHKMPGNTKEAQTHVIVWTPWAEQNKTYAIAADVPFIFYSPIGKPIDTPADVPLAKYVRECWENEHGEPFYFMDWTKMVL